MWDISTLTHTHTLDGTLIWWSLAIALTQDEQHLVSCSHRHESLKVWCTTSLSCLRTVQLVVAIPPQLLCHSQVMLLQ